MSFVHAGTVRIPPIPNLTVTDVWQGINNDYGKSLYKINEHSLWTGNYIIVPWAAYNSRSWCYCLQDSAGIFGELKPASLQGLSAPLINGMVWWNNDGGWSLYMAPGGNWVLARGNPGHLPTDDENRYEVSWSTAKNGMVYATPAGPWVQYENPPSPISFNAFFPRWYNPPGWGTPKIVGSYSPADGASDSIQVGVPSWFNPTYGTLARSAEPVDGTDKFYYIFQNGATMKPDISPGSNAWGGRYDSGTYAAMTMEPAIGSTCQVLFTSGGDVGHIELFSWQGWMEGYDKAGLHICELARMF